jgi:glycosyltransferase involved in cell wall biosynthesis
MKIVVDLQAAQNESRLRGIGRYALAMAQALARNAGSHEVFIAVSSLYPDSIESIRSEFEGLIPQSRILVWSAVGPVSFIDDANTWRRQTAELLREAFIASLQPDIVFIPSIFGDIIENSVTSIGLGPAQTLSVVTSHDLIPLMNEEVYLKPHPVHERFYRTQLAYFRRADAYLAISESSMRELVELLDISPERIANTAEGANACFRPIEISSTDRNVLFTRLGIQQKYLMYSGATDERKNHLRLIKAFSLLPVTIRENHQLVFVGGLPNAHREKFARYAKICGLNEKDLVITGRVTDYEMVKLYNLCDLFVFPSWHEGFGLPVLEAMACGAPVIGSNTSSLPEVIGHTDALFDPFDVNSISEKITEVLTNNALRESLGQRSLVQAKKFSWDLSAIKAIDAFEAWHSEYVRQSKYIPKKFDSATSKEWLIDNISNISVMSVDPNDWILTAQAIASNHPDFNQNQLFVDVSEFVLRDYKTGIQRVVRSVLSELLSNPPENFRVEPVYAAPVGPGYCYARQFTANFLGNEASAQEDSKICIKNGDIFFGLDLKHDSVINNSEYFKHLRNIGVRVYFLVHDLLPVLMPNVFHDGHAALHSQWLSTLAENDGVVCVSRTVADEFSDWLDVFGRERLRPFQIGWSHNGADISGSVPTKGMPPESAEVLSALSRRPTFLMVGTIEPRKGQLQTLLAFEQLWAQGLAVNLVLVGKEGWNVDLLVDLLRCHSEMGRRLFWLKGISDEYLETVYQKSSCLIFASEGEGFGLPLIEAAQHKLPIIARDIPVFREVAGKNALYFSGLTPDSIAQAAQDWLVLDNLGQAPQSEQIPWLSWKESTGTLLQSILGGNWYREWMPDGMHRYWGGDSRLGMAVGERNGRDVKTNGKAGHLLYGPYLALPAGRYRIAISGSVGRGGLGDARMDVAIEVGVASLAETLLTFPDKNGHLANISFVLATACKDLEVRVMVSERSDLTVSMVEIAPWQPDWAHRFLGSDKRLSTKAGKRDGHSMVTNRQEGDLLYGPYMPLEAGRYTAIIRGNSGANGLAGAWMDVVANQSKLLLGKSCLFDPDENGSLVALDFSMEAPCTDLEVRIWVSATSDLTVSMIEIAPWRADQATNDNPPGGLPDAGDKKDGDRSNPAQFRWRESLAPLPE